MKVAIIGAGICGLYLARKLAERGEDVSVFEKKSSIGKQSCSGLFSERLFDYIPESKNLVQNQIDSTIIHFPKKDVKVSFSKKFFVMSHFELDKLVAELAKKAGAKVILNHQIDSLLSGFDRIIGCDGANSMVRKNLGLSEPKYRLAIQGFIKKQDLSDFVETWAINKGFIWKIPREGETEYGIIAEPKQCRLLFDRFLSENKIKIKRSGSALVYQGFLMPSDASITLCGEAIGLTKPWSGGGVIWGLKSCELLLKYFPDFLSYKKAVKRFFVPEIIFSKFMSKLIYFFGFNFPWILPKETKIDGDYFLNPDSC